MKKLFIMLMLISIACVMLVPCSAYKMDSYTFNGGSYNETMHADAIHISYCNVDGYFFAGNTLTLGGTDENQRNMPALCSYPVPSMLGRNIFGDFVPFALNEIYIQQSYSAPFPADDTQISYSLIPNVMGEFNDVMIVDYEIPNAHSLYFVGSFGHHFNDYGDEFVVKYTAGNVRISQKGTYYLLNHIEDGATPHLITIPVDRSWSASGNSVDFDVPLPDGYPNEVYSWYFVGSILVQPSVIETNPDFKIWPQVLYRTVPAYEYSVTRGYYDNYEVTYTGEYHNFAEKFFTSYITQYTNEVYGVLSESINENGTYVFPVSEYEGIQVIVDVPQEVIVTELPSNAFTWLIDVASSFLEFEIAPNFTIGGIMILCVGFALIMWLLKVFLGG